MKMRGLLVDFGGVLTTDIFASFEAFCTHEGLPLDAVKRLFLDDPVAYPLLVGLEDGSLPDVEFEERFAALLGVAPEKLIDRMLGHATLDDAMLGAIRAARRHGIRTGLVTNSWGVSRYDRTLLTELFDSVIISAEVGLRKPNTEIYELGARSVGLDPNDCVYVDDLPGNLKPARALGMTTLHHHDAGTTIAALAVLFGLPL
jgi:epoxide hydrolase-like predicted phosphatase